MNGQEIPEDKKYESNSSLTSTKFKLNGCTGKADVPVLNYFSLNKGKSSKVSLLRLAQIWNGTQMQMKIQINLTKQSPFEQCQKSFSKRSFHLKQVQKP